MNPPFIHNPWNSIYMYQEFLLIQLKMILYGYMRINAEFQAQQADWPVTISGCQGWWFEWTISQDPLLDHKTTAAILGLRTPPADSRTLVKCCSECDGAWIIMHSQMYYWEYFRIPALLHIVLVTCSSRLQSQTMQLQEQCEWMFWLKWHRDLDTLGLIHLILFLSTQMHHIQLRRKKSPTS